MLGMGISEAACLSGKTPEQCLPLLFYTRRFLAERKNGGSCPRDDCRRGQKNGFVVVMHTSRLVQRRPLKPIQVTAPALVRTAFDIERETTVFCVATDTVIAQLGSHRVGADVVFPFCQNAGMTIGRDTRSVNRRKAPRRVAGGTLIAPLCVAGGQRASGKSFRFPDDQKSIGTRDGE